MVYPLRNALVGPEGEVHIEPKVMQVLEMLAESPGEVVGRDELLDKLWDGRAMSDEPLTRCIASLRQTLGDSPKDPKYIQTIPKRGYRLIATPKPLVGPDASNGFFSRGRYRKTIVATGSVLLVVLSFVAGISQLVEQADEPELTVEGSVLQEVTSQSIAVLPFRNLSPESDDSYIVDGIHADILTNLSKVAAFDKVISSTSVEQYRNTDKPVPLIANELRVAAILEGGLQRAGDRVRINVQLIDATTDDHLWAETYDRELTAKNLFAVQSEIAREVTSALKIALTDEETDRINAAPTASLEAYSEYVRGLEEMRKRQAAALYKALEHFIRTVELDPTFADAYANAAAVLGLVSGVRYGNPGYGTGNTLGSFGQRQYLLDLALEFDPQNGLAHTQLAVLNQDLGNPEESERLFQRAIELTPNAPDPHGYYGFMLAWRWQDSEGFRREEALQHLYRAHELAPAEPVVSGMLSQILMSMGRDDESTALALESVKQNPNFSLFYRIMAIHYRGSGELGEALRWYEAGRAINSSDGFIHIPMCQIYFRLADHEATKRCLESLRARGKFFWEHEIALLLQRGKLEEVRHILDWAEGRFETTVRLHQRERPRIVYHWLVLGDVDRARLQLKEFAPGLFDDGGQFTGVIDLSTPFESDWDALVALLTAMTLHKQGDTARADEVFDAVLEWTASVGPFPRGAFDPGALDGGPMVTMPIHAIRQDREAVLRTLREGLDEGYLGWFGQGGPLFDFIRDDPEWIGLMKRLDDMTARQWDGYNDHRNEPLF
jgi:TolB-like protein/DNA-binding winged helix-turn-helix (wHTH) protein